IEDDVDIRGPDALDDRPVERRIACPTARVRVADMDVCDSRACPGGLDCGVGDLIRRHRDMLATPGGVSRSGDRTGDENFPIHGVLRSKCELPLHILRWTYHNRPESDGAK